MGLFRVYLGIRLDLREPFLCSSIGMALSLVLPTPVFEGVFCSEVAATSDAAELMALPLRLSLESPPGSNLPNRLDPNQYHLVW